MASRLPPTAVISHAATVAATAMSARAPHAPWPTAPRRQRRSSTSIASARAVSTRSCFAWIARAPPAAVAASAFRPSASCTVARSKERSRTEQGSVRRLHQPEGFIGQAKCLVAPPELRRSTPARADASPQVLRLDVVRRGGVLAGDGQQHGLLGAALLEDCSSEEGGNSRERVPLIDLQQDVVVVAQLTLGRVRTTREQLDPAGVERNRRCHQPTAEVLEDLASPPVLPPRQLELAGHGVQVGQRAEDDAFRASVAADVGNDPARTARSPPARASARRGPRSRTTSGCASPRAGRRPGAHARPPCGRPARPRRSGMPSRNPGEQAPGADETLVVARRLEYRDRRLRLANDLLAAALRVDGVVDELADQRGVRPEDGSPSETAASSASCSAASAPSGCPRSACASARSRSSKARVRITMRQEADGATEQVGRGRECRPGRRLGRRTVPAARRRRAASSDALRIERAELGEIPRALLEVVADDLLELGQTRPRHRARATGEALVEIDPQAEQEAP